VRYTLTPTCGENNGLVAPQNTHTHTHTHTHSGARAYLPNPGAGLLQWNIRVRVYVLHRCQTCSERPGDRMHENMASCKQCAVWMCSHLSAAYFLWFLTRARPKENFGGKRRLFKQVWDCVLYSGECSAQQRFWGFCVFFGPFFCPSHAWIAKYVEHTHTHTHTQGVEVSRDVMMLLCVSRKGILSTLFSHLSPVPHTNEKSPAVDQHTGQTCPQAGTTHTHTHTHTHTEREFKAGHIKLCTCSERERERVLV